MLNSVQLGDVDLNLLVLCDVVLRERNVARAARAMHLSPSAVSHGLARLRRLFADPLFLRVPKGVVPTERALSLAPPIAEILARVGQVVASATPFSAATSARRFTLGMADSTAACLIPALLADIRRAAPAIDIGVLQMFPQTALADLEARSIDLAVAPLDEVPARFASQLVFQEDFVIAARAGHPFLKKPSTKSYCDARHVLASVSADSHGFIDDVLAQKGLSRRVTLVVPNFMLALASLADTDLVTALPRGLVHAHAARFGVAWVEVPFRLRSYELRAIALQSAMSDAGLLWLFDSVTKVARHTAAARPKGNGASKRSNRQPHTI
ncbi:MAG TPA: LysR family transcriptional regulator [Polyangiaceae bacterium]